VPAPDRLVVIAIDGPAASGKSSTARRVAAELGFRQGDSGAIYRAVTAARLRAGGAADTWTEASVLEAAAAVSVVPVAGAFGVRIAGQEAEAELRGSSVTGAVSTVARMSGVRAWVNARMRECAAHGPIVVDGRDMGTAVFPDAPLKVWLVADPAVRARRRSLEMLGRLPSDEELARAAADLAARDAKDATQTKPAADAVLVDTTRLTPDEQVSRIVALARERLGAR
jgi:cytidylate kinase